jgi:hypothetical protein
MHDSLIFKMAVGGELVGVIADDLISEFLYFEL